MNNNYASAKVAILHPLKIQFRENLYKTNDRLLPREYIATFAFNVYHLTGEIFTLHQLQKWL